ncbi:hypothetical protein DQE82_03710 [Micromonospora sp. LHW51205]|uniref:Bax inhibitor-1/YccA family membrane protein n=1 Tax=Micromonospora sp. LHW51205 TaxID=2248752 RepID=UPI000DEB54F4|nr:hypothetical protein DQE82_03710 [Micromonospora sp. LHW51205]
MAIGFSLVCIVVGVAELRAQLRADRGGAAGLPQRYAWTAAFGIADARLPHPRRRASPFSRLFRAARGRVGLGYVGGRWSRCAVPIRCWTGWTTSAAPNGRCSGSEPPTR